MFRKAFSFLIAMALVMVWPVPLTHALSPLDKTLPVSAMAPARWLTVTSPNGGEVMTVGDVYHITWRSSSNINRVSIGYKSCPSCLNWIVSNIPNKGYYDWTVSVGNTTRTQFTLQITGYQTGSGSVIDYSDSSFTVLPKPTPTRTNTATPTTAASPTYTPTSTNTATPTPTNTSTATATATHTIPTPTPTSTVTPTRTFTFTPTVTRTPLPTNTPTFTSTPTDTPTATATSTPSIWLTVTSPNGGEVMNVGDVYHITWQSSPNIDTVSIMVQTDPYHGNWVAFSTPNTGYYDWTVFVGNTTNTQFQIQITGYQTGVGSVSDTSDASFTVLPAPTPTITPTPFGPPTDTPTPTPTSVPTDTPTPTVTNTPTATATPTSINPAFFVTVTSPNGGEVMNVGDVYRITWQSSPNIDTVSIMVQTDPHNGNWVAFNIPNTGYYDWTVNVGNTTNTQFKIEVIGGQTGVGQVTDISDAPFTVLQLPTPEPLWLTITSPNGGEVMTAGDVYHIAWQSSPKIDKVTIMVLSYPYNTTMDVAVNIPNTGYYDWTVFVGNTTNTQFRIWIIGYQTGVGSVSDYSDAPFTVLPAPTPTATSTLAPTPTFTPTPTATNTPTAIVAATSVNGGLFVTSPNGGEVMTVGDIYRITWASSPGFDTVDIMALSYPSLVATTVASGIPDTGYYDWTVNVGNTTNTQFTIAIIGYQNGVSSAVATSNAPFTVLPAPTPTATPTAFGIPTLPTNTPISIPTDTPTPTVTNTPTATATPTSTNPAFWLAITSPNGGEVMTAGSVYRITWQSSPNIDTVAIGYKSCPSCLDWIAFSTPNTGYYDWPVSVGNTINTQFTIQITGYQTGVGSVTDTSDAPFTVLQPPTPTATPTFTPTPTATLDPFITPTVTPPPSWITVTAPNGGEVLNYGDVYRITWQSSPDITNVYIIIGYHYTCAGCLQGWNYEWGTPLLPNTGYYDWTVNVADPTNKEFMVLVENASLLTPWDTSDGPFTVVMPVIPTIPTATPLQAIIQLGSPAVIHSL